MTAAPPMLQHADELEPLVDLYRDLKPKRVLEVGTYQGGTLYHWLTNGTNGTIVVAVDTSHQQPDRYPQWARAGVTVVTVHGESQADETKRLVYRFAPYDFAFIDADHHNDIVRADWNTYSAMTRPGGIVALHDILPTPDPTIEVDRLWAELADRYETVELIADGGYGIGVVYMP